MLPLDCCCEISAGLVICNLPAPRLQPGPATTQRPYWRGPASSQPITARAAGHVMLAAGTVRSLAALLHSQGQERICHQKVFHQLQLGSFHGYNL